MNPKEEQHDALPEEARAALRRGGDRLLTQLDAMREDESASIQIEPLDPGAELALRQHGEKLLAHLAEQRPPSVAQPAHAMPTPPRRGLGLPVWIGIAAAVFILAAAVKVALLALPSDQSEDPAPPVAKKNPQGVKPGQHAHPISPAVPEPSSALLAMVGGAWLLCRRRRS